jgi:hypothetical protein
MHLAVRHGETVAGLLDVDGYDILERTEQANRALSPPGRQPVLTPVSQERRHAVEPQLAK